MDTGMDNVALQIGAVAALSLVALFDSPADMREALIPAYTEPYIIGSARNREIELLLPAFAPDQKVVVALSEPEFEEARLSMANLCRAAWAASYVSNDRPIMPASCGVVFD